MRLAVVAVIGLAVVGLVAILAWGLTRKEPVTGSAARPASDSRRPTSRSSYSKGAR